MASEQEVIDLLSSISERKSGLRKRRGSLSEKSLPEMEEELVSLASSKSSMSAKDITSPNAADHPGFESGFETFNDFLEYASEDSESIKSSSPASPDPSVTSKGKTKKSKRFIKSRRIRKWLEKGSFKKFYNWLRRASDSFAHMFRGCVFLGSNVLIVLIVISVIFAL